MKYELAKELKDAGFPQNGIGIKTHYCLECKKGALATKCFKHEKEFISHPTLSELIEACGESGEYTGFELDWSKKNDLWTARLLSLADNPMAVGSTPEEAVAHLWLALNKKI